MDNNSERIKAEILLELAKTVELFDLTPIEARVFAYLYIKGIPLTLDDMGEALGKSKTSMSNSVRSLLDLNLVNRVWKKGIRKDLYQANTQLYRQFMSFYMKKWTDQLEDRKDALLELNKEINQFIDKEDPGIHIIQEKLNSILIFHNNLDEFFKEASEIKKDGR